jgi:hypothetical protein
MPGSCAIWPPNDKMVQVGTVTASDALSGVASGSPAIIVNSNEPLAPSDVGVDGGVVRASVPVNATAAVPTVRFDWPSHRQSTPRPEFFELTK